MQRACGLLFASLLLVSGQVSAQGDPGARTHDGFFLRFLAGGGPGAVTLDNFLGSELKFTSDAGGAFHFQIGGAVSENLILFGDIGGFTLTEPDVEWAGQSGSSQNLDVTASGLGGGLTYYFMPSNFYVSGSALVSMNSMTFENQDVESEFGPAIFLAAGKEWWVGNNWGLGVALFTELGWTRDKEDAGGNQSDMRSRIFGVAFSATMN